MRKYNHPRSNENFTVHCQADYYEERVTRYGTLERRRLYEVTCNHCGSRRDLRKYCITNNGSCGCKPKVVPDKTKRYDGKTLIEWSELTGISKSALYQRMYRKGLNIHEAIKY